MKLGWVIHYVQDVEKTISFYENAFGLERAMLTEGREFGTLATGETVLAFCEETFAGRHLPPFTPVRAANPPIGVEIALVTQDVDTAYARAVQAGANEVLPPQDEPWGQRVAYVRDLNGFLVELCSPLT